LEPSLFYLLTGTTVFDGDSIIEICMKHTQEQPETPSKRLGKPVSEDLEQMIMKCLEKRSRKTTAVSRGTRSGTFSMPVRWEVDDSGCE